MDVLQFIEANDLAHGYDLNDILGYFKVEQLEKNQTIIPYNSIARKLFIISEGMMRIFTISEKGKEITYGFFKEGDVVTISHSFFTQEPSKFILETIEPTLVSSITFNRFNQMIDQYPVLEKIKSETLLHFLNEATERIMALQMQSAHERYNNLMLRLPEIFQRAPLGHIASFLGITQETLSRIRAK